MNIEDDDIYDDDVNTDNIYLTFSIDNEEYAFGVFNVIEIVKLQKIIPMPDVADYIKGVINLRGKVIPVMDIRKRLGLSACEYIERTIIIVLENEKVLTGIAVDKVNDVTEIFPGNIELPSHYSNDNGVVKGVGNEKNKSIIILNIAVLMDSQKTITEITK
jgi:purine-binding chemotaxis protein CheW